MFGFSIFFKQGRKLHHKALLPSKLPPPSILPTCQSSFRMSVLHYLHHSFILCLKVFQWNIFHSHRSSGIVFKYPYQFNPCLLLYPKYSLRTEAILFFLNVLDSYPFRFCHTITKWCMSRSWSPSLLTFYHFALMAYLGICATAIYYTSIFNF